MGVKLWLAVGGGDEIIAGRGWLWVVASTFLEIKPEN